MTRLSWILGALAEFAILAAVLEALGASLALALPVAFLLAASSVALVAAARRRPRPDETAPAPWIEGASNVAFVALGLLLIATGERGLVRGAGLAALLAGLGGAAAALQARRRLRREAGGPKL